MRNLYKLSKDFVQQYDRGYYADDIMDKVIDLQLFFDDNKVEFCRDCGGKGTWNNSINQDPQELEECNGCDGLGVKAYAR